jgi:hypothetical protein
MLPLTYSENEIIRSIQINGGSEILIGRKEESLHLKFNGSSLVFRDAVDSSIPIGSYAEFQLINTEPNGLSGIYKQEADIDLMGTTANPIVEWTAVGNYYNRLIGTFDGNGKNTNNLYINKPNTGYLGLFGYIGSGGAVKNVHIQSGSVTGGGDLGGVAGYIMDGSITDCYNSGNATGAHRIGGVVGNIEKGTITACHNTGSVTSIGGSDVGGVVGYISKSSITACYNTGVVSCNGNDVGGVVGSIDESIITNCYNTGTVFGNNAYTGGVAGYIMDGTITDCHNAGTISGSARVGGVVGYISVGVITNCYNTGNISGNDVVGGVVGWNIGDSSYKDGIITACYNSGVVSGDNDVGGVVGRNRNNPITACYNVGAVSGDDIIGGVAGRNYGATSTITSCYNIGAVSGSTDVGGVAGRNYDAGTITACYWATYTGDGVGNGAGDATKFSGGAWPSTGSNLGQSPEWGIGAGSGSGTYWKTLGGWNGGNPSYPQLWWE